MSKDRIQELQTNISWPTVTYTQLPQECVNHEDESQCQSTIHQDSCSLPMEDDQSSIPDFLQEIDIIQSKIEKMHELSQKVKDIHIQMIELPLNSKLGQELDEKNDEMKRSARETSVKLKKMEEIQRNASDLNESNAYRRIKDSQIFVLTRRFRNIMAEHHKETIAHRERCKKAVIVELEMSGQRMSKDELEKLLDNDCSNPFNFSLFINTEKAKHLLDDTKARHLDMLKLEEHIKELHSLVHDLATYVADQGELIDRIEYNVETAQDYVKDGAGDMRDAEKYYKQATRKKTAILIILIVSVSVTIIILLMGFFTQRQIFGR